MYRASETVRTSGSRMQYSISCATTSVSVCEAKSTPFCSQKFADLQIVFDDAIVHHGDAAVLGDLRVGVDVVRLAVGGPAGMADAERAGQRRAVIGFCDQILQPALGLFDLQNGRPAPRRRRRSHIPGIPGATDPPAGWAPPAAFLRILRYHTYEIVPPVIIMLQDKRAEICLILRSKPLCFAVARIFADFVTRTETARERIRRILDHVPPRCPAGALRAGAWRL